MLWIYILDLLLLVILILYIIIFPFVNRLCLLLELIWKLKVILYGVILVSLFWRALKIHTHAILKSRVSCKRIVLSYKCCRVAKTDLFGLQIPLLLCLIAFLCVLDVLNLALLILNVNIVLLFLLRLCSAFPLRLLLWLHEPQYLLEISLFYKIRFFNWGYVGESTKLKIRPLIRAPVFLDALADDPKHLSDIWRAVVMKILGLALLWLLFFLLGVGSVQKIPRLFLKQIGASWNNRLSYNGFASTYYITFQLDW